MGAGHAHGSVEGSAPDPAVPHSRIAVRAVLAVIIPLAVATLIALVVMWPADPEPAPSGTQLTRVTGTIVRIDRKPCPPAVQPGTGGEGTDAAGAPAAPQEPAPPPTDPRKCGDAVVDLTSGSAAKSTITTALPSGPGARVFAKGDKVILVQSPGAELNPEYLLSDHDRSNAMWLVAAAFALAVIAFGRWRGLTALAGLAVTFALLLWFLIPAILGGAPPLAAAIVCASAIMLAVLYLTHGFSVRTSIAVMGTLASLILTGLLAIVAIGLTHLTGIIDDNSLILDLGYRLNAQGLLLASIIIGSLGVLDDVTVTQVATVTEVARADPACGFRSLYRAAGRVGRAHIASVINTIVLAYAGASLPLLLLFTISSQPLGDVLTNPVVAQEIVRSVAGTLGLIAAVPITTALAALVATRSAGRIPGNGSGNGDGSGSGNGSGSEGGSGMVPDEARGKTRQRREKSELPDPLTDGSYF